MEGSRDNNTSDWSKFSFECNITDALIRPNQLCTSAQPVSINQIIFMEKPSYHLVLLF